MSDLEFNDGVEFNTDGPFRIEKRVDGFYVVGHGFLLYSATPEEAEQRLERLQKAHGETG